MTENGKNGVGRIPLSAILGTAVTLLVAVVGFGVQQFNQLRQEFDRERLSARREYAQDLMDVRETFYEEIRTLRKEAHELIQREHAEMNHRIAEIVENAREMNRTQDQLIDRVREQQMQMHRDPADRVPP